MNCFNCQKVFDQKSRTPRLLIFCGHSLCQCCCQILFSNNKIVCPQCKIATFSQKVQFLPKNLALICNSSIIQKQTAIKQCSIHNKKYQAFCSKQKMLICIDCILYDGHKNHQMDSIKNSYKKQFEIFNSKVQKIENFILQINGRAHKNKQNQQISRSNYSEIKEQMIMFFKNIRNIVDQQEATLMSNILQSFQVHQNVFNDKNQQFQIKLNQISNVMSQCQQDVIMEDIQFLQTSLKRNQKFQSFKFQLLQAGKVNTFCYPKNSLIQNLVKSLNLIKQNGNKANQSVPNSSVLANQKKNKAVINDVNNNVNVKVARKNPITSIQVNQSNSSKLNKKISIKKQPIQSANQNSGITVGITNQQKNKNQSLGVHNSNINQKHKFPRDLCKNARQNQNEKKKQKQINKIQPFEYQTDLSTVYCRESQSLCNSFMSNMTSFLSEKKINSIYLIGGFNQDSNNIIKLNLNAMRWQNICVLENNRSKFGAIGIGKQIYLFGGKKGKQRLADVQSYNIQTNQIKKLCSMPNNRSGFGIVNVGDLVFIIGGNDGQNILNTVQTYNIKTNQWKKKPSMKDRRDQLAVIIGDHKIYAIGGFGGLDNQPLKSVEVFDLQKQQWKSLPELNYARRALSAAFLADGVYAIGGFNGTSYMKSVQKYEQGQDRWIQVSQMNIARCTHSSISLFQSQQIYVFGGFDYFPLDIVQRYSLITNQWQKVCQMPAARFMHSNILIKQQ